MGGEIEWRDWVERLGEKIGFRDWAERLSGEIGWVDWGGGDGLVRKIG